VAPGDAGFFGSWIAARNFGPSIEESLHPHPQFRVLRDHLAAVHGGPHTTAAGPTMERTLSRCAWPLGRRKTS
jgi:hypothetical protein